MGSYYTIYAVKWTHVRVEPLRRDDAAGFRGTRVKRTAFGRPSRARCVTPAAAARRPSPTVLCLHAPRCGRQRQDPHGSLVFRSFRVADAGALPRILRAICEPGANSGETPSPCAQLIERDGQSGLVGHGCQLGRQIKGDAMAARALAFDRALGAMLLLSLLSLARDDPRAHIVPRAKPTVVCAVCRGICHSGTGRARVAGPATV